MRRVAHADHGALLARLAREVEQRAHDLLDLEPGLLDEDEPVVGLRAWLGLLQEELDEPEDREERVVDLVRDPGRELADGRELPALGELLLEATLLREVGDEPDDGDGLSIRPWDLEALDLDGDEPSVLVAEERLEGTLARVLDGPPASRARDRAASARPPRPRNSRSGPGTPR